jgi:hypothetical protein
MGWVLRQSEPARPEPAHSCDLPDVYQESGEWLLLGDLWVCDVCTRLWRIGNACPVCDRGGRHHAVGQCIAGFTWRRATRRQRWRHRKAIGEARDRLAADRLARKMLRIPPRVDGPSAPPAVVPLPGIRDTAVVHPGGYGPGPDGPGGQP